MPFTVQVLNRGPITALTIDEAILNAAACIHTNNADRDEARAALRAGKPYTFVYGFNSVTIEPTPSDPALANGPPPGDYSRGHDNA